MEQSQRVCWSNKLSNRSSAFRATFDYQYYERFITNLHGNCNSYASLIYHRTHTHTSHTHGRQRTKRPLHLYTMLCIGFEICLVQHTHKLHSSQWAHKKRGKKRRLIIFIQRTSDTINFMPPGNNHHFVHIGCT